MKLYEAIHNAWEQAGKTPWNNQPGSPEADAELLARKLDKQLHEVVKPILDDYDMGALSATELVDKLFYAAHSTEAEI